VLVTRNVGCRSGFRGILALRPRKCRKASRGRDVERRMRSSVWTRPVIIVFAEGCCGRAKAVRPAQAPRSWCPAFLLACDRACRDHRRRVGVRVSRALTPLVNARVPGSAKRPGSIGGCRVAPRGEIHAPETLLLRSLPQPIGAGSSRPLSPLSSELMPYEEQVPRLQGRKTLASLLGPRPRERPPRDEKPTANDDATSRRKREWRTELAE